MHVAPARGPCVSACRCTFGGIPTEFLAGKILKIKKKILCAQQLARMAQRLFLLPDFGECHVGVDVFQPGLVPPLH